MAPALTVRSRLGSCFRVAQVGAHARVVLELLRVPYFRECWLDCMCRVVRVDEQAGAHVVAFEVQRYHFLPFPQSASADP